MPSSDRTPIPQIILIGAGGHGRACIDVIEQEGRYAIAGLVDRRGAEAESGTLGYPVLGTEDDLAELRSRYDHALLTVGGIYSAALRDRVRLFARLRELDFTLPVVVSPLAYCSPHAHVGEGTILMHRAVVNLGAHIGVNCIINTASLLEHDVQVGDHTHIAPMGALNGKACVGSRSFVGSNATVMNEVVLPDDSFVRAGQLVISPQDVRRTNERRKR